MDTQDKITKLLTELSASPVIACLAPYAKLDLSRTNSSLIPTHLQNSDNFSAYIDSILAAKKINFLWGGYLEKRSIYQRSDVFNDHSKPERDVHLGIDLWCPAGTPVFAALDGEIHSFQLNDGFGDYGPTIILKHTISNSTFYTLYGHLSLDSLSKLQIGQSIKKGEPIAKLGTANENGDYPPHLHFQIILDMEEKFGDYPGVCSEEDVAYFSSNCPDPNLVLKLHEE